MRQKVREKKGDTHHPLCLSDKEDHCLPNDVSWMSIHESFTLEEELKQEKEYRSKKLKQKGKIYYNNK